MSFVVIGDDYLAQTVCDHILTHGHIIEAVVTSSRSKSQLVQFSKNHSIPCYDVSQLSHALQQADWLVSANSTVIIPQDILAHFPRRALNFHPGLLPQYAGLYPFQWAIRNGEQDSGATTHFMTEAVDAGDIIAEARFPLSENDTGLSVYQKCIREGAVLFQDILTKIVHGEPLPATPQELSKRHVYTRKDALRSVIPWEKENKRVVDFIRASNFEPFTSPSYVALLSDGIHLLRARVIDKSFVAPSGTLVRLTPEGPVFVCGDHKGIIVTQAKKDKRYLTMDDWNNYASNV
jgi:methionyl-tRNA formyltransferase